MTLSSPQQAHTIDAPQTASLHEPSATALRRVLGMSFVSAFHELKTYIKKLKNRAPYIPLIVGGFVMLPQESQAQCCGLGYSMVGLSGGSTSTRDDYYANRKNGWTRDGYTVGAQRAWQSGHYRGEVDLGTSKNTKYEGEDRKNRYKAYFPYASIGQGVSFTDAEARIVPYLLGQGGVIGSLMSGVDDGKEFVYHKANIFLGAKAGGELNIAERFKLGVSADMKIIPNGKLDNIPTGSRVADFMLSTNAYLRVILN